MESEGGGGFLSRKFMGIPSWVILAGAALLAYWYFSHKGGVAANTTTGGGGSVTTGNTRVQSGAVRINVSGGTGGDEEQDEDRQPKPPHHHGHGGGGPHHHHGSIPSGRTTITVHDTTTLEELAERRGWNQEFTRWVEKIDHLKPSSKLKKGQKLTIPSGNVKPQ